MGEVSHAGETDPLSNPLFLLTVIVLILIVLPECVELTILY